MSELESWVRRPFRFPGVREIGYTTITDLNSLLRRLLKHQEDGSVVINEETPEIRDIVILAKKNGHDAVLEIGQKMLVKSGELLADHPRYADVMKVTALVGTSSVLGIVGIVIYKHQSESRKDSKKT